MEYEDGDLKYAVIGKSLTFLGDDEYAVIAYQMRCGWAEGKIHFNMGCTCDNCGAESIEDSARMVCRTCGDIDLCEDCYHRYQRGGRSKRTCIGHEFLRVPTIPEEELRANFPRPEGSVPHQYFRPARTTEMASVWMDELRAKYPADTISSLPDLELKASFMPGVTEHMIPAQMHIASLRLPLPIVDDAVALWNSAESAGGHLNRAETDMD